jgi:hypothetical protein
MSPFPLEGVFLIYPLLTQGFVSRLDACAPADLQAPVVWLVDMLVLLPMLPLAFLAQNPLHYLMGVRLRFLRGFFLLPMLLSSCCASGLYAFLC